MLVGCASAHKTLLRTYDEVLGFQGVWIILSLKSRFNLLFLYVSKQCFYLLKKFTMMNQLLLKMIAKTNIIKFQDKITEYIVKCYGKT